MLLIRGTQYLIQNTINELPQMSVGGIGKHCECPLMPLTIFNVYFSN